MSWFAWILSGTTLFSNALLGWAKGAWWAWLLWSLDALLWQFYTTKTGQYGLTPLNLATFGIGIFNAYKRFWAVYGEWPLGEDIKWM